MTEPDVGLDDRHRNRSTEPTRKGMKMERVTFPNAAIEVVGNLHKPADFDSGEKYPRIRPWK